jgi:hypothetical protein
MQNFLNPIITTLNPSTIPPVVTAPLSSAQFSQSSTPNPVIDTHIPPQTLLPQYLITQNA